MNIYKATQSAVFACGYFLLNKDQQRRRARKLEAIDVTVDELDIEPELLARLAGDDAIDTLGVFGITEPIEFKTGELFGHDNGVNKRLAEKVIAVNSAEALAEIEAPAADEPETEQADADATADETTGDIDLQDAIALLQPENPDHWTSSNKPEVKMLRAITGRKVTAKERDAAWQQYQADNGLDAGAGND